MADTLIPAFVTGTSSEYLGRRPLRKIFRERHLVVILGPKGSGKSRVARRIASFASEDVEVVSVADLKDVLVQAVRRGSWPARFQSARALVLDGPTHLRNRPGVADLLVSLIEGRAARGLQTVVCDSHGDGSAEELLARAPAGSTAVLGLRFPSSRSGRLRFARRLCDELGLSRCMAGGTENISPWGYGAVLEELRRREQTGSD